jgi:hypothetical protein
MLNREKHEIESSWWVSYPCFKKPEIEIRTCDVTRTIHRLDGRIETYSKTYKGFCPDLKYIKYLKGGWTEKDWPKTFLEDHEM